MQVSSTRIQKYLVGIKQYVAGKESVTFDDIERDVLKPDEIPNLNMLTQAAFQSKGIENQIRKILEKPTACTPETDEEADKRTGYTKAMAVLLFNFEQCQRLQDGEIDRWSEAWTKRRESPPLEYANRDRYARWLAEDSYILEQLKEPPSLRKPLYETLVRKARTGLEKCIGSNPAFTESHAIKGQMELELAEAAKEMLLPPPKGLGI